MPLVLVPGLALIAGPGDIFISPSAAATAIPSGAATTTSASSPSRAGPTRASPTPPPTAPS